MLKFKKQSVFFLCALFLCLISIFPAAAQDRSGSVILKNNRADSGDYPFILEAKLVSEKSSELVFEIKYFMSDTIGDNYSISVHPNNSSWAYSRNTLRPGINTETVTVSFHPETPEQIEASSRNLMFDINRFENCVNGCNCKDMGIIFTRTIDFSKTWSN